METPKFILSKKKVLEQYNKIKEISDVVSYSSKTNPIISEILEENTESMFSVHLINELKNIKDFSRVLFLAQGWNKKIIEELVQKGIRWFVVDNEKDLKEILGFLEKNEIKINLLLRARVRENTIRTERYFVFGMNSDIINEKIKEIRTSKINNRLESLGIHFHRKSQNIAEWDLKREFENILQKENLDKIDIVNIGGGIPAKYVNTNLDVISGILKKISEFRIWLNNKGIRMMAEPGRFIAAPSAKLITKILGIYDNNVVVNVSVYNSDMDALIVPTKLLVEGEFPKKDFGIKSYIIKGVTPCSMDLFRYRVYLRELKIGDRIVFLNAGAYNFSTDFCNLKKIETEIIE